MKRLEDYEVGEKGAYIADSLYRSDDVPKLKFMKAEVSKEVALGIMTAFHTPMIRCDNKDFVCIGKVDHAFMRGSLFLYSHDGRYFIWTTVVMEV